MGAKIGMGRGPSMASRTWTGNGFQEEDTRMATWTWT